MANNSQQVGIDNSWSLSEFKNAFGKMKITAPLVNSNTGETFKACAFVNNAGNVTLVGFSSNLGELSAEEIKSRKDELQVVKLSSGTYKLCTKGAGTWEDVDI